MLTCPQYVEAALARFLPGSRSCPLSRLSPPTFIIIVVIIIMILVVILSTLSIISSHLYHYCHNHYPDLPCFLYLLSSSSCPPSRLSLPTFIIIVIIIFMTFVLIFILYHFISLSCPPSRLSPPTFTCEINVKNFYCLL